MVIPSHRGNGLFIMLVSVTLGCSLYDLMTTVRHLDRQAVGCFEATVRSEYLGVGQGVASNRTSVERQQRQRHKNAKESLFPATPRVTPLLLLPENMEWRRRKANARHLLQDGVAQSPWLAWWERNSSSSGAAANTFPDDLVLVLDLLGARDLSSNWCHDVSLALRQLQQERLAQLQSIKEASVDASQLDPLPLAVIDNRDYPVISYCPGLSRILLQGHNGTLHDSVLQEHQDQVLIRYSYRSAVLRRKWQPHLNWVRVGRLLIDPEEEETQQQNEQQQAAAYTDDATDDDQWIDYHHRPIGVRTDIVQQVQEYLTVTSQNSPSDDKSNSYASDTRQSPTRSSQPFTSLCHPLEQMPRDIHVSYFWDHQNHSREDAHLRDTVYEVLSDMAEQSLTNDTRQSHEQAANAWTFQLGVQGENRDRGRKRASPAYVVALMNTQIVVVAQRDEWEDHYRLFEAAVSGAMVMTDRMLGLPDGLVDGESVVTFSNSQELRDKVLYYLHHSYERLRIARQGRFIAMSRHRSWHHMEQVVFGKPMTVCGNITGSKCPYVVNVSEMREDCPLLPIEEGNNSMDLTVRVER